eukprot:Seg615.8 transcript_id=Seg615.8/GoldUCD/mRNA.D3Y31 product="hypothetical protein" protein_id=Seg615.8/GoldUCD/D3Y31
MSCKDFLKSVEGKLLNNKRKAEPDMRVDVLLGCTSKRIRREIIHGNLASRVEKEQLATSTCNIKSEKSLDEFCDLLSVAEINNNVSTFFVENWGKDEDSGLVDDPKQVELFLRQVESQYESESNKEQTKDTGYSDKSKTFCEPMLAGSTDLDLGLLCANFETLYEELLDSLISVERWMNLASSQMREPSEDNSEGVLCPDQQEITVDIKKLLSSN